MDEKTKNVVSRMQERVDSLKKTYEESSHKNPANFNVFVELEFWIRKLKGQAY